MRQGNAAAIDKGATAGGSLGRRVDPADLVQLAMRGLQTMFDPESGLFCFTLRRTSEGPQREGTSHRYTMMSVLGLHRLELCGGQASPIVLAGVCERLLSNLNWLTNAGDLGLLLWTCALVSPHRVEHVLERVKIDDVLTVFEDARRRSTTELAWLLTGLTYVASTGGQSRRAAEQAALATERALRQNQGRSGFFGHMAATKSVEGLFRSRIGSFADQVYPIYALAQFGRVFGQEEAVDSASRCADAICGAQGPLGQWWWHYDARTGRVMQRYPVYSVHQEGMAPMALFALGDSKGPRFVEAAYNGLEWLASNELSLDLRDRDTGVVWRDIERRRARATWYPAELADALRGRSSFDARDAVVNYECRPYELGWLLYAFAPRVGQ